MAFPNHMLKPLSLICSDHCCPLLLQLHANTGTKRRFRFESFWTKLPGFNEVVATAWETSITNADPFCVLDYKFRNVAKVLRRWSNAKISSVRLQLAMAREVIQRFDEEEESRVLSQWEAELHKTLKLRVLGLASLAHTIARQCSRLLFLAEGDANTKFYHLQACHQSRKNRIDLLRIHGADVVSNVAMADALYEYYIGVLGTNFERSKKFDLHALGVPHMDMPELEHLFTEEEVWSVVVDLPNDKAQGPYDFTGLFYKKTWGTIKMDVMNAFNAFWSLDSRNFNHLNDAYMILLKN